MAWFCFNDAFLSIVKKDCPSDSLLVRARRPGDIEKVFGRRTKVVRATDADYLYRAVVPREEVIDAMGREVLRINYSNFKSSVGDDALHDAYLRVWTAMASLQDPRPYSEPWRPTLTPPANETMGDWPYTSSTEPPPRKKKHTAKERKRAAALIRKNGASVGSEPR